MTLIYENGKPSVAPRREKMEYLIKRTIESIRWFPHDVWQFFRKIIYWAPVIWKDRDYDYTYIYDILIHKLLCVANNLEKKGYHVNSKVNAKQIRYAVLLMNKIKQNDFCKKEFEEHYKKWGEAIMDFVECPPDEYSSGEKFYVSEMYTTKAVSPEQREQESEEINKLFKLEREREELYYIHLFDFLRKNIRKWWT